MHQCQYKFWRGDNKGQQCPRMTKSSRCYKHKDCHDSLTTQNNDKVEKMQKDEVFGDDAAALQQHDTQLPRSKGKVKSSVYLITINSNKTLESLNKNEKKQFKDYVDFIFAEQNLKDNYIIDNHGDDINDIIESIDIEHHFEISPVTNRLHCHAYINIQHHGHISFKINDIRALAAKIFKDKIYINLSVSSDPTIAIKNYTRKMNENKVEL
jgi:hypothetical protein